MNISFFWGMGLKIDVNDFFSTQYTWCEVTNHEVWTCLFDNVHCHSSKPVFGKRTLFCKKREIKLCYSYCIVLLLGHW